jgi:hypothetical protein
MYVYGHMVINVRLCYILTFISGVDHCRAVGISSGVVRSTARSAELTQDLSDCLLQNDDVVPGARDRNGRPK